MTDFLQRYEEQLRAAQVDAPGERPSRAKRLRSVVRRRPIILTGAFLLVMAVPATALVAPWEPSLSRAGLDAPVATSSAQPAEDAESWLGVLRRPQTEEDRRDSAPFLPSVAAGNRVQGVQVDAIRSLSKRWALVPVASLRGDGPAICIVSSDARACGHLDKIRNGGPLAITNGPDGSDYAGLVPDGVTKARFTPETGDPIEVGVSSNFYELHVDGTSGKFVPVTPPPGYEGPPIPPKPAPVSGKLEYLDGSGKVVGPAVR
jgi:hypothetical protein